MSNLLSTPFTSLSDSSLNYVRWDKYQIALIHTLFQRKYSSQTFREIQDYVQHMVGAMFGAEEVHITVYIMHFVI